MLVLEPETFGRSGRVTAALPADALPGRLADGLRRALAAHSPSGKTFAAHVREGRRQGAFWETALPVTDPQERRARERGRTTPPG